MSFKIVVVLTSILTACLPVHASIHTVFTTECGPYFTWQSLGKIELPIRPIRNCKCKAPPHCGRCYSSKPRLLPCSTAGFMSSYRLSGQKGNVTRLMSCDEESLKDWQDDGVMPTHIAPSWTKHPRTGDLYRSDQNNSSANIIRTPLELCYSLPSSSDKAAMFCAAAGSISR